MKKLILAAALIGTSAAADAPVVMDVTVTNGRFDVTLTHPDTGWDDYADGWRVEDAQGNVLGTRVLGHPHVNEQPFTRSLTIDVPLPETVFIRARDTIGGWASDTYTVQTR